MNKLKSRRNSKSQNVNEGILDTVKKIFNKNTLSNDKVEDVAKQILNKFKNIESLNNKLLNFSEVENNLCRAILFYPTYRVLYKFMKANNKTAFCTQVSDNIIKYIIAVLVNKKISDESHRNQGLLSVIRDEFSLYNEEILPLLSKDAELLISKDGYNKTIPQYISDIEKVLKILPKLPEDKSKKESISKKNRPAISNRLSVFFENIDNSTLNAYSKDYKIVKSSILFKLSNIEEQSKKIFTDLEKKLAKFDNENNDEKYLKDFVQSLLTEEQYRTLFISFLTSDIDEERFQDIVTSDKNHFFENARNVLLMNKNSSTEVPISTINITMLIKKFNKNYNELKDILDDYKTSKDEFLKTYSEPDSLNNLIVLANSFNSFALSFTTILTDLKEYLAGLNSFLSEKKKEKIDVDDIMKGFDDIQKNKKSDEENDFEIDKAFSILKTKPKAKTKKASISDEVDDMFAQIKKEKRLRKKHR